MKTNNRTNRKNEYHFAMSFSSAIIIVAGVMDLSEASTESGVQHKSALKLVTHPNFDAKLLWDDICMIKV